jgi:D-lyxose ketol-isomerase
MKESKISDMVKQVDTSFRKHYTTLMQVFNTLEQRAEPYTSIEDLFDSNQVVLVAANL